jgi:hypothetical protein
MHLWVGVTYSRSIWSEFGSRPFIRDFHVLVKVMKYIYSKYVQPVKFMTVSFFPCKFSFLSRCQITSLSIIQHGYA